MAEYIKEILIICSGTILLYVGNKIWAVLKNYLQQKQYDNLLKFLEEIIELAVRELQPLADEYKKASSDGKLSSAEKALLVNKAKELIYNMLPLIKKEILESFFGKEKIEDYVESLIEKYVSKNK